MQKIKMSLANIQGKLNRNEMKNIMAGWDSTLSTGCKKDGTSCGSGKKCKSTSTSCLCDGSDDGKCYLA